jgi:hypothetical protein
VPRVRKVCNEEDLQGEPVSNFPSTPTSSSKPRALKHLVFFISIITTLSGCSQSATSSAKKADTLTEKFLTDEWLGTHIHKDSAYLMIPDSLKTVDTLSRAYIGMIVPYIRELDPNGRDTMVPTWMIDGYWSGTWELKNDSLVFTDDDEIIGIHKYFVRIIDHNKIELKRYYIDAETDKQEVEYVFMERKK